MEVVAPIRFEDDKLFLLDQTLLPIEEAYVEIATKEAAWDAIKRLVVRGAPAIGVAAGYSLYIAAKNIEENAPAAFLAQLQKDKEYLDSSRPTAINLHWALQRVMDRALAEQAKGAGVPALRDALRDEAVKIHEEDIAMCRAIGEHGAKLLKEGMGVLTHCNAGALATSRYGTALAPIYVAAEQGVNVRAFCDETRPLLQGSRLTAYELVKGGIDTTLICDDMAAVVMKQGKIDIVIVGADHVAANGDAANKIGTYGVALLAKAHGIPFYVACPSSTIAMHTPTGEQITIEQRDPQEVICGMGKQTAPADVKVFNPAFDVTPNELIAGIITEKGVLRAPYAESLKGLFA